MPGQATEVWAKAFQDDGEKLPKPAQEHVIAKVRGLGRRLESFSHERLQGRAEFRLRVGDYRVIYSFELARNILSLHLVAHRRDVYR